MSNSKVFKVGRDPKDGKLVPVKKALANPKKYIVESMPKKGHGDVKKSPKK